MRWASCAYFTDEVKQLKIIELIRVVLKTRCLIVMFQQVIFEYLLAKHTVDIHLIQRTKYLLSTRYSARHWGYYEKKIPALREECALFSLAAHRLHLSCISLPIHSPSPVITFIMQIQHPHEQTQTPAISFLYIFH